MADLTPRTPTFTFSSTTRTTCPLNVPSGTAEDDLMLAFFAIQNATDPSTQTDWTVVETVGATALSWGIYWRRATASEPASYTFSHASARDAGIMISIPGVDWTTGAITGENTADQGTGNQPFGEISPTGEHVVFAFLAMTEAAPDQPSVATTNCDSIVGQEASEAGGGQNVGVAVLQEYLASGGAFTPTYTISTTTLTRSGTLAISVLPASGAAPVEGQGAAAFGGTFTGSGVPTTPGAGAASFGFTATAQGVPTTPGTASVAFGGTFTATGTTATTVTGQGAATFGGTVTASGTVTHLGQGAAAFGGTITAAGIDRALGAAVAAFSGTATASGTKTVLGAAVSSFGGTIAASGEVPAGTIVSGTASASFGGTVTAAGVDRALGVAVAAFGATLAASGLSEVFGQSASAFGFTASASGSGYSLESGTASATFGFAVAASGTGAEPVVTWTPPTYEVQIQSSVRILSLHRLTTANTIVRVGDTFQSFRTPRAELLEGLTEGQDYFRGGYVYELPQSLVTELLNAGFPSG